MRHCLAGDDTYFSPQSFLKLSFFCFARSDDQIIVNTVLRCNSEKKLSCDSAPQGKGRQDSLHTRIELQQCTFATQTNLRGDNLRFTWPT